MTKLSWLLYLSDVGENMKNASLFFGLVLGLVLICLSIVKIIETNDREKYMQIVPFRTLWGILVILWVLVILAPSQKTVLLIAASEASQAILTSDKVDPILNVVRDKIMKELEEPKK